MSYEELKLSAAILCEHISYPERPILHATHDSPIQSEDSGWQFLCGIENHEKSEAKIWALHEVVGLDSSVRRILDAEPETSFERSAVGAAWRIVPYQNEDA